MSYHDETARKFWEDLDGERPRRRMRQPREEDDEPPGSPEPLSWHAYEQERMHQDHTPPPGFYL